MIQGFSAAWRVMALSGSLLLAWPVAASSAEPGLPTGLQVSGSEEGLALTDAEGRALYRLDLDRYPRRRPDLTAIIAARCADVCDRLWRPAAPPAGFSPAGEFGTVQRKDGATQLTFKGDPLYTFAGKSLDEAAAAPVALPYLSSYTGKGLQMREGVPVSVVYWRRALYQPAAPKTPVPSGVSPRWSKTTYVLAAGERSLYVRQGGCDGDCDGLERLPAPLAALPVGAWRPTEDAASGRRFWSYRGQLVYAAQDATTAPPGRAWRRLEAR